MKKHIAKWKFYLIDAWRHLGMFFRPFTVIGICLLVGALVDIVCLVVACAGGDSLAAGGGIFSTRDLLFAVSTGVTASVLVSVCVEGASNYKRNHMRLLMLSDYLSAVAHYEMEIGVTMKMLRELRQEANEEEDTEPLQSVKENEAEKPQSAKEPAKDAAEAGEAGDRLHAVALQIPEIAPVLQEAYETRAEYMSYREVYEIKNILSVFRGIEDTIGLRLLELTGHKKRKRPDYISKKLWEKLPVEWKINLYPDLQEETKKAAAELFRRGMTIYEPCTVQIGRERIKTGDDGEENDAWDVFLRMENLFCGEFDRGMCKLQKLVKKEPIWWHYMQYMEKHRTK